MHLCWYSDVISETFSTHDSDVSLRVLSQLDRLSLAVTSILSQLHVTEVRGRFKSESNWRSVELVSSRFNLSNSWGVWDGPQSHKGG
jgi:hypothetical protein